MDARIQRLKNNPALWSELRKWFCSPEYHRQRAERAEAKVALISDEMQAMAVVDEALIPTNLKKKYRELIGKKPLSFIADLCEAAEAATKAVVKCPATPPVRPVKIIQPHQNQDVIASAFDRLSRK
jgi:hypothetical protein